MAETGYVKMLRESLEKKVDVLLEIREMNRKQKELLENHLSTPDELDENLSEKQDLIDRLSRLDNGFEQMYQRVRVVLSEDRESYQDEIRLMQDLIRQITDLSAKIQKEEAENKAIAERRFSDVRSQATEIRKNAKAVNLYYQNMMKNNLVDPQFLDNKK